MWYKVSSVERQDELFIREAFKLAKRGKGWTNPGPMVGCVIVKNGKIIAKGYYHRFGGDHAEMDALKHAQTDVKGATMYVTLEPCHLPYDLYGQRVPCTEIISQAGIRTVYISMLDSNPQVNGRGKQTLEEMGIHIVSGILEKEALRLNEAYHHFMTRGRPFVAIQFGASLDGKIATKTGDSKLINNESARVYLRKLRGKYQSILVGINTVLHDDPQLGVRMREKKDPIRIILDSSLKIPLKSKVLRDKNVLIATTLRADQRKKNLLQKHGIELLFCGEAKVSLKLLLNELVKRKVISILVEGGGSILGSFVDEKLVDKVYAFHAPLLIGGERAITVAGLGVQRVAQALKLKDVSFKRFGDNMLTVGYIFDF